MLQIYRPSWSWLKYKQAVAMLLIVFLRRLQLMLVSDSGVAGVPLVLASADKL